MTMGKMLDAVCSDCGGGFRTRAKTATLCHTCHVAAVRAGRAKGEIYACKRCGEESARLSATRIYCQRCQVLDSRERAGAFALRMMEIRIVEREAGVIGSKPCETCYGLSHRRDAHGCPECGEAYEPLPPVQWIVPTVRSSWGAFR